jgi:hypothetical protein
MLDPQARFLPNVNPSNPGKMVDWVGNPAVVAQFPDQFKPYEIGESAVICYMLYVICYMLYVVEVRVCSVQHAACRV